MNVIWKGTTKAGFGAKGKVVVAWYCEKAADAGDADAAKDNIGAYCMVEGRNECFATKQLEAQNEIRIAHAVPELAEDPARSKAL
jgi:hypothetical protein